MLACRIGVPSAALARRTPVKVVVEDGFDRAVGPGADVDGAFGGGFQALGAMGTREPDDAKAGAKALFGMWARLKDQFAQGRRRRPDQARVGANAFDRPAGIAPMAGRHVLGDGRVLVVAAGAHMRGDPLALEENLDGPHRQPRVDLGAGEAMGHAVIMGGDLDVIIDADAASPPF